MKQPMIQSLEELKGYALDLKALSLKRVSLLIVKYAQFMT